MFLLRVFLIALLASLTCMVQANPTMSKMNSSEVQNKNKPYDYPYLKLAPAWGLKHNGELLGARQLYGKPYVLHFWATWCPYCKRFQHGLEKLAVTFNAQNIHTYAISFWENENTKPQQVMASRGLNLTVLDQGDDVAKLFNVQGTPTTIFINHKGEILTRLTTSNPNDPQVLMAYKMLLEDYKQKE